MTIEQIEAAFSVCLPDMHRAAIADTADPIHKACAFLVVDSPGVLHPLYETNTFLRREAIEEWPDFLFAFASNGFGDYFAYDTRQYPYRILYIDPDFTIEENLTPQDGDLRFDTFEQWHQYVCQKYEADSENRYERDA